MNASYPNQKAKEGLPRFFWEVTAEVVTDSSGVYWSILIGCITLALGLIFGGAGAPEIAKKHNEFVDAVSGIYLLLPPFVLAIIAMFPAFSDQTKKVLSAKIENKDKAFGAVFLNEFAFLTFWSLVVLGHNAITKLFYPVVSDSSWATTLVSINVGLSLGTIAAVGFEIFHSIKIMYLLVLREFY